MRDDIPVVMHIVSGAVAFDAYLDPAEGTLSQMTMFYADVTTGYRRQNTTTLAALDSEFKLCASDPRTAPALRRMADALRMIADRIDVTFSKKEEGGDQMRDDQLARMRRNFDAFGSLPPSDDCPAALFEANQKCLDDLAFIIGKATRNEDESPIVRATVAPKANGRRIR